ncbi:electron transport complex subunit RsxC [Verrucomicrobiota bacterium]
MKRIKAKYKVHGGVHPRYNKTLTCNLPITEMPLPSVLRISMAQHLGAPAKPIVAKGDTVLRGQLIGEPAGFISTAVHAPVSGTIKTIAQMPTATGMIASCVEIESDGEDRWIDEITGRNDWQSLDSKKLVSFVADAGIAGMGGAGFPTHVKLSPPENKPIDVLIINGAECEPFLTADSRLMIEHAQEIWDGCRIIRHILGAKTVRIAIEDNKPEAFAAMEKALRNADGDVAMVMLKTEYPQGAEKQQIYAITGREVPSGGLPMDVGCVVDNVGTAKAVYDAVVKGKPLVERITTVTGPSIKSPGNIMARIGTSYSTLVDFCGGTSGRVSKVISGGPMMGFAVSSLEITTTKTTSGILVLPPEEISGFTSMPCIGCGRCVGACPTYLMPCELSQMLEAEDYETAENNNVMDCIECGCCAFECPARRPLVQHMRQGKGKIMEKRRQEKEKN